MEPRLCRLKTYDANILNFIAFLAAGSPNSPNAKCSLNALLSNALHYSHEARKDPFKKTNKQTNKKNTWCIKRTPYAIPSPLLIQCSKPASTGKIRQVSLSHRITAVLSPSQLSNRFKILLESTHMTGCAQEKACNWQVGGCRSNTVE